MDEVRSLKVLVSAHAFSPVKGSEHSVGWDYVRAIASIHKVWVIARSIDREETEQYLLKYPNAMPNVTIHYVPIESRTLTFPGNQIVYQWFYRQWQRRAFLLGRALDREIDFDLIHEVNLTGFRAPGYLWKLGKPFVWGPVCGLQFIPLRLLRAVPLRKWPFSVLMNLSTAWAMHLSRGPKRTAAAAQAILSATSEVAERIQTIWGHQSVVLCEVSAPDLEPRQLTRRKTGEPLRIVWSGRCAPLKTLNIVLLALQQLQRSSVDWQLVVMGDGPLLDNWKALAHKLGIAERCVFLGRVSRAEVFSVMASGHCFVQPSLYDATSTVMVEALANGLPVICLDQFGFKDAVNAECGIKIPPQRFGQVIRDFANAIETIGTDEERRYKMAVAAQKASLRLTWKHKAKVINDLYNSILPPRELQIRRPEG